MRVSLQQSHQGAARSRAFARSRAHLRCALLPQERLGDVLRNVYDQIAHMSCVALRVTEDHAVCVSLRDAPVTLQEVCGAKGISEARA